ncbi:MAG: CPBP family glutamic-type intramembrane protease [Acidobacteriota bacterium]
MQILAASEEDRSGASARTESRQETLLAWIGVKIATSVLLLDASVRILRLEGELWTNLLAMHWINPLVMAGDALADEPWSQVFAYGVFLSLAASTAVNLGFLGWFYERYRNLEALGAQRRFAPKWTVLGFFIPVVHFVLPHRVATDLWQASLPDDENRSSIDRQAKIVTSIWAAAMLSVALASAAIPLASTRTWEDLTAISYMLIGSIAAEIVAYLFLFRYVGEVERRQRKRWRAVENARARDETVPTASAWSTTPQWYSGPRRAVEVFILSAALINVFTAATIFFDQHGSTFHGFLIAQTMTVVAALIVLHRTPHASREPLSSRPSSRRDLLASLSIGVGASLLWIPLTMHFQEQFPDAMSVYDEAQVEVGFLAMLMMAVVVAPLAEELAYRGVMLQGLRERLDTKWAVVVTGLLFAIAHPYFLQRISTFVLGCLCGAARVLSGSLWTAIVIHAASNFCVMMWPELLPKPIAAGSVLSGLALIGTGLFVLRAGGRPPPGARKPTWGRCRARDVDTRTSKP